MTPNTKACANASSKENPMAIMALRIQAARRLERIRCLFQHQTMLRAKSADQTLLESPLQNGRAGNKTKAFGACGTMA
jgi:hypothetical protein